MRACGSARARNGCRTSSRSSDLRGSGSRPWSPSSRGSQPRTAPAWPAAARCPTGRAARTAPSRPRSMQLAGVFESDAAPVVAEKLRTRTAELLAEHGPGFRPRRRPPRHTRRDRRRERSLGPRRALPLDPRVPRGCGTRAADSPRLRGHPLGQRQHARPHRGARDARARLSDASRHALPPRAARHAETGAPVSRLHGADARTARRPARARARRPPPRRHGSWSTT